MTWLRRRKPKWSHPCPVCNARGYVAPHPGQHPVITAPLSRLFCQWEDDGMNEEPQVSPERVVVDTALITSAMAELAATGEADLEPRIYYVG